MKKLALVVYFFSSLVIKAQWSEIYNFSVALNDVEFTSNTNGIVVGNNGIYKTTNGGLAWTEISNFESPSDQLTYESSHFYAVTIDDGFWYACGQDTVNHVAIIIGESQTTSNWLTVYQGATGTRLNDIFKPSSGPVYAVGNNDQVIYSPSSSTLLIWQSDNTSYGQDWKSVHKATGGNAYVASENMVVRLTTGHPIVNSYGANDIFLTTSGNGKAVDDEFIYYGSNLNQLETDFAPPLDGNCILAQSGTINGWSIIGTDDGIFYSSLSGVWGKSIGSEGYQINNISIPPSSSLGYAVCQNGAVLKTNQYNDNYLPFVNFSGPNGGCKDSLLSFVNLGLASDDYEWYLDGTLVSNSDNCNISVLTNGLHVLKLIGDNDLLDSISKSFFIVDVPDENITYSLTDSTICFNGAAEITIHSPQLDTWYSLINVQSGQTLAQGISPFGADLILLTSSLSDSCKIMVFAKSVFADCEVTLLDTVNIIVENPIANFNSILTNAAQYENTTLYNISENADYFEWTILGPDPSISLSTLESPTVSFSSQGEKTVQLVALAEHGCSDTLIKVALNVTDNSDLIPGCWSQETDQFKYSKIEHFKNSSDILILGDWFSISDAVFPSKKGWSKTYPYGSYQDLFSGIARYTTDGVYKWTGRFYMTYPDVGFTYTPKLKDVQIAESGNIYLACYMGNSFYYVSPGGDTTYSQIPSQSNFMVKLDSNGTLIWIVNTDGSFGSYSQIELDQYENIYYNVQFDFNSGAITQPDGSVYTNVSAPPFCPLIKLNSDGYVQWATSIWTEPLGAGGNLSIALNEQDGSLYLAGSFGDEVTITGPSGNSITQVEVFSGSGTTGFVAKLDANGEPEWLRTGRRLDDDNSTGDLAFDVVYDSVSNRVHVGYMLSHSTSVYYGVFSNPATFQDTISTSGFVLCTYSTSGDPLRFLGISGHNYARSIPYDLEIDQYGNVYTTGYFTHDNALAAFTSANGDSLIIDPYNRDFWIMQYDTSGAASGFHYSSGNYPLNNMVVQDNRSLSIDWAGNKFVYGSYENFDSNWNAMIANDSAYLEDPTSVIAKFDPCGCVCDIIGITEGDAQFCKGDSLFASFEMNSTTILQSGNIFHLSLLGSGMGITNGYEIGTLNSFQLLDSIAGFIPLTGIPAGVYEVVIWSDNEPSNGTIGWIEILNDPSINVAYNAPDLIAESLLGLIDTHAWYFNGLDIAIDNDSIVPSDNGYFEVFVIDTNGCKGFANYNLVTFYNTYNTLSVTSCGDYSSPSGLYNWTSSGTYSDTIANFAGYDSIITINLSIVNASFHSMNASACASYVSPSGNLIMASGTYLDTIMNVQGCDSIITINLVIDNPVVSLIDVSGADLVAVNPGDYKWMDCNDGQLITGETNNIFSPLLDGSYALITTNGTCSDTSDCIVVIGLNLEENGNLIMVAPNPSNGEFKLYGNFEFDFVVLNVAGEIVLTGNGIEKTSIDLTDFVPGVYFLQVTKDNSYVNTIKLIKL
jgi:hypothetical protein